MDSETKLTHDILTTLCKNTANAFLVFALFACANL